MNKKRKFKKKKTKKKKNHSLRCLIGTSAPMPNGMLGSHGTGKCSGGVHIGRTSGEGAVKCLPGLWYISSGHGSSQKGRPHPIIQQACGPDLQVYLLCTWYSRRQVHISRGSSPLPPSHWLKYFFSFLLFFHVRVFCLFGAFAGRVVERDSCKRD